MNVANTRVALSLLGMLVTAGGCSRSEEEGTGNRVQDKVTAALQEFAKSGPGTITRIRCEKGTPTLRGSARESGLHCAGPNGSETETVVRCKSENAQVFIYLDTIGVFCPESSK